MPCDNPECTLAPESDKSVLEFYTKARHTAHRKALTSDVAAAEPFASAAAKGRSLAA